MIRQLDIFSLVLTALSCMAWGALVALGFEGLKGVVEQHVRGYPVPGQVFYYFWMPVIAFVLSLMSGIVCFRLPRVRWIGQIAMLIALLALLPFLFLYTGGV